MTTEICPHYQVQLINDLSNIKTPTRHNIREWIKSLEDDLNYKGHTVETISNMKSDIAHLKHFLIWN